MAVRRGCSSCHLLEPEPGAWGEDRICPSCRTLLPRTRPETISGRVRDLSGERFGKLQVIGYAGRDSAGSAMWLCRCVCGITRTFRSRHLVTGHAKSCGCAQYEDKSPPAMSLEQMRKNAARMRRDLKDRRLRGERVGPQPDPHSARSAKRERAAAYRARPRRNHCGVPANRRGRDIKGQQRYQCRVCGFSFTDHLEAR